MGPIVDLQRADWQKKAKSALNPSNIEDNAA
jgi:hypothetical protein